MLMSAVSSFECCSSRKGEGKCAELKARARRLAQSTEADMKAVEAEIRARWLDPAELETLRRESGFLANGWERLDQLVREYR